MNSTNMLRGIAVGLAVFLMASMAYAQSYAFTSNLTVGSTGPDVVALQNALIAQGYSIPSISSGAASTGYFGAQTQAAVKAYQAAKGIPSTGFVGPLTRAALNSAGSTPVTQQPGFVCPPGYTCIAPGGQPVQPSSTSLSGGEGQIIDLDLIGSISGEDIDEGERNARVLGVEFEADDSDIRLERVDVDFIAPGSGSRRLTDYVSNVSLWLDGTRLASIRADTVRRSNNNRYSFRFSGLSAIVREGDTAQLYVAIDAVNNVDSNDTGSWMVRIPTNGIRATDGAGISETYVDGSDNLEETFSIGASNAGELDLTLNDSTPREGIVVASGSNETSDVTLLVFDLEADESGIAIDDLPVGLVASGSSVKSAIKTVKLVRGSTVLKSKSIPASAAGNSYQVIFDNLDLRIDEGDRETYKVVADINRFANDFGQGDGVYATTSGSSAGWDVEDAQGDNVTPSGSAVGEAQLFYEQGISANLVGTSAASSGTGVATFEISFTVRAIGDDIYLSSATPGLIAPNASPAGQNTGALYSTSSDMTGSAVIASADLLSSVTSSDLVGSYYKINRGQTRSFKLQVVMSNNSTADLARERVFLRSLNWSTTTAPESFINQYSFNLGSFVTDPLSWKTAP